MLIRNGRLVDPAQRLDAFLDVRVSGTAIAEIGERLRPQEGEEIVDANGAYVAPGFIDMHVHLREPGNPEKETIASGTAAAAAGGFTAVAAMPNTKPAIDTPQMVRYVAEAPAAVRVYPVAAITRSRAGSQLLDYTALAEAGAVAFSDDGNTVMDAGIMRAAAIAMQSLHAPIIAHCEDERLKADAVMSEGAASRRLGLRGSPRVAEDAIVARDLLLAEETGKAWHIAHLSTARSLELVRDAKRRGAPVTCEVAPHHLLFTDEAIEARGSHAKVNPPLRTREDADALAAGVRDGVVDAFATDHAPHTREEKDAHLACGAVGFSGLEVAVGAYALAVPDLSLLRFVELLSTNPARILRVPGGTLAPGSPADITIFADEPWRVDPSAFRSKGQSTPLAGMTLPRRAIATIVGGRIVMRRSGVLSQVHAS